MLVFCPLFPNSGSFCGVLGLSLVLLSLLSLAGQEEESHVSRRRLRLEEVEQASGNNVTEVTSNKARERAEFVPVFDRPPTMTHAFQVKVDSISLTTSVAPPQTQGEHEWTRFRVDIRQANDIVKVKPPVGTTIITAPYAP